MVLNLEHATTLVLLKKFFWRNFCALKSFRELNATAVSTTNHSLTAIQQFASVESFEQQIPA